MRDLTGDTSRRYPKRVHPSINPTNERAVQAEYFEVIRKFDSMKRELDHHRELLAKVVSGETEMCISPGCREGESPRSRLGLCDHHLEWCRKDLDMMSEADLAAYKKEKWEDQNRLWREQRDAEQAKRLEDQKNSVVYYIDFGKRIKIGTTSNLSRRIAQFSQPISSVLAVEPGSFDLETHRHRQFAHLRYNKTELFDRNEWLMEHIEKTRMEFGDPAQFI